MGRAKRRHVARYGCADVTRVACQRHGRPRRSLRCWRGWRDSNQPRCDFNRPEIVDQNLGAHAHVWNFFGHAAIEMSLLIDKPNARYFAVTILAVGLILRGLVQERRMKKE